MPGYSIEESGFRTAGGGRRIFRDTNATIGFGNDGKSSRGRLPPVVSSLFSIKAAHLKRSYQRHGAGSKVRVKGFASRGEGSSTSTSTSTSMSMSMSMSMSTRKNAEARFALSVNCYRLSDVQATRLPLQAISRVKGCASRGVRHSSFVISPITQQ
jgi:hypothetical protein